MILDILFDTVVDSVKLLPFLFLTYLLMEWLEHKTGSAAEQRIRSAGKSGPVWGALLGVVPQCGFSAAASSLYAGRVITIGTLFAVFLSTSDEMLPILISEAASASVIIKILAAKVIIGAVSGLIIEFAYVNLMKKREKEMDIHVVCEEEHCHCEDGMVVSALKHTLKIFFYIFVISLVLNAVIAFIGEDTLSGLLSGTPVVDCRACGIASKLCLLGGHHTVILKRNDWKRTDDDRTSGECGRGTFSALQAQS